MKKMLALVCALTLALGATAKDNVKVTVKNPVNLERKLESVELNWAELKAKMPDISPKDVVVMNKEGKQVPFQVLYKGAKEPVALLFQADAAPKGSSQYTIGKGTPENFEIQATGRFVHEKREDFYWENNKVGYRVYGPQLEKEGQMSNGIDIFIKYTPKMILETLYFLPSGQSYHKDTKNGGMDNYWAWRTLGAGAMAPFSDEQIWYPNNFVTWEILDKGPLRIHFKLTYAPFDVNGKKISQTREISLDANTHLSRISETYTGDYFTMPVVAGMILREEPREILQDKANNCFAYYEPVINDLGHTAIGVVMPQGLKGFRIKEGEHTQLLGVAEAQNGVPYTYYAGAGWSGYGFEEPQRWFHYIESEAVKIQNPLKVSIK